MPSNNIELILIFNAFVNYYVQYTYLLSNFNYDFRINKKAFLS